MRRRICKIFHFNVILLFSHILLQFVVIEIQIKDFNVISVLSSVNLFGIRFMEPKWVFFRNDPPVKICDYAPVPSSRHRLHPPNYQHILEKINDWWALTSLNFVCNFLPLITRRMVFIEAPLRFRICKTLCLAVSDVELISSII